jgi:hypothetical protein
MFDRAYREEAEKWVKACVAWAAKDIDALRELDEYLPEGEEAETFDKHPFYWEWTDNPPKEEWYRPEFTAPADHFQYYENVSEGTPVSPVFATREELAVWLVESYNYSEDAAHHAAQGGWVPSGVGIGGVGYMNGAEGAALLCHISQNDPKGK